MEVNAYVNFAGNCREAFEWYATVLDGTIIHSQTVDDHVNTTPEMGFTEADRDKIMHMALQIGSAVIMGSDSPPAHYQPPRGIHLSVGIHDPDAARKAFDQLAEGGQITMPFAKTFWADGFGMLIDRFSVPWMVNCSSVADPAAA